MIIPMHPGAIYVIWVGGFLLPRGARPTMPTRTAISLCPCPPLLQPMPVVRPMRCASRGRCLHVSAGPRRPPTLPAPKEKRLACLPARRCRDPDGPQPLALAVGEGAHPVPAERFGLVDGAIGGGQQLGRGSPVPRKHRNSNTHTRRDGRAVRELEPDRLDAATDPLRHRHRLR